LVNGYGSCLDTSVKQIQIVQSLSLANFQTIVTPTCNGKTSVLVTDTSSSSVAWTWSIKGFTDNIKTTRTANYILQNDNTYYINLISKQSSGCLATVTDTLILPKSSITIVSKSNDSLSNTSGCAGLKVDFSTEPTTKLKSYLWDFGDGNTSTASSPTHIYNNVGIFPVLLTYQTEGGCTDTVWLRNIQTFSKPIPSFTTPIKIHCGGRATFYDLTPSPVNYWTWDFGDNGSISHDKNPYHNFGDTGYFDIKLIAFNGTCFDSVTYPKFIYIIPPIIDDTAFYSCDGVRNIINFGLGYRFMDSGTLNFGDGSPTIPVNSPTRTFTHQYPKSGVYLTQFTASKGQCKAIDSLYVGVVTKQFPKISSNINELCQNDSLKVFIDTSKLDKISFLKPSTNYYNVFKWQLDDTTTFKGAFTEQPLWYFKDYFGKLSGMPLGNHSFKVILKSAVFV
jgi:PKD repeat protein